MTRKRRRLFVVLLGMALLSGAVALVLTALKENLNYFYSPSDIGKAPQGPSIRLGGLVEEGSLDRQADGVSAHSVPVPSARSWSSSLSLI